MRVVIAGGGFCGATVSKKLHRDDKIKITLIDEKEHFVYYPSLPSLLSNPRYLNRILVSYTDFLDDEEFVKSSIENIFPDYVETKDEKFDFDYLVISLGVRYPIYLDNKEDVCRVTSVKEVLDLSKRIEKNDKIIIIGGGLIGTEVSAELAEGFSEKQITLVHSKDRLIERNPPSASIYAERFLRDRNVKIVFNQKIEKKVDNRYVTDKGFTIKADLGIWCAGIDYKTNFMTGFGPGIKDEKNRLKVNEYLQLNGYENIYVGGDITDIPEEKTGQNADRHANIISENLQRVKQGKYPLKYKQIKNLLLVGLGKRNALLIYSPIVLPGPFSKFTKKAVERAAIWRLKY